jgi:hypothetical protein
LSPTLSSPIGRLETMKEVPKQVSDLVERFQRNIEAYRSPTYNETQLRIEFVDPFFEALGWDVTNTNVLIYVTPYPPLPLKGGGLGRG